MRLSRIATDQRALEVQRNTMANAESTLGDVVDALQQFRELVVSAGNGSHTAAERQTIANQLQGLREQILGYANRTDTNGQPLFGALASASVPFTRPDRDGSRLHVQRPTRTNCHQRNRYCEQPGW